MNDRQQPHASDSERAVLACCLLDPHNAIPALSQRGTGLFYDLRHQVIANAAIQLHSELAPVDGLTVLQKLRDAGQWDKIGPAFFAEITESTLSASAFDYHLEILEQKATLRKIIRAGTEAVQEAFESSNPDATLDAFEQRAMAIRVKGSGEIESARQVSLATTEQEEKNHAAFESGTQSGIRTGFAVIDEHTCGWEPKQLVVIAARPSVGKSTLIMNIAENMAILNGVPVGVISLEMTNTNLMMKCESSFSKVPYSKLRRGDLSESDFASLSAAKQVISRAPLFFCERGGMTVSELRFQVRSMVQRYGVRVVFIDYLQRMAAGVRTGTRDQEIGYISAACKSIAVENDINVTVASQLNRAVEKRDDKMPTLSDLRESGSIEQDGDVILLMNAKAEDVKENPNCHTVGIQCAKQRNGPQFYTELVFLKTICRMEQGGAIDKADLPNTRQTHNDY